MTEMKSKDENYTDPEIGAWLPCCYGGWFDMSLQDRKGHSAEGIFNCSCYSYEDLERKD
jgi:hypothetical protein